MEPVGGDRFLLTPASAQDAEAYSRLHLRCLETAYAEVIGPEFAARIRADAPAVFAEDAESLARPDTRAVMAWARADDPALAGSGTSGSGAAGPAVAEPEAGPLSGPRDVGSFTEPVGLALALDGPQDWEWNECGAVALEGPDGAAPRDLVNLYVLPAVQGLGLGSALLRAVLPPEEPAYLWIINGNDGAERFYERHGFRPLGEACAAGGPWTTACTGRMVRGLTPPSER